MYLVREVRRVACLRLISESQAFFSHRSRIYKNAPRVDLAVVKCSKANPHPCFPTTRLLACQYDIGQGCGGGVQLKETVVMEKKRNFRFNDRKGEYSSFCRSSVCV
jgi:hypothetical protein